ncbi:MAG: OmpH family outer membrane protein, partial [Gammaproteobacteria bacterium]|nr:OmpH family outer membrane protein [Gammaproteobacteria bacterium]
MSNSITAIVAIVTLLCASAGVAQGADMNIGVVNIARLLDESPQAKSAMKALQDEFAPRQRGIQSQEESLRSKEEELKRNAAV